MEEYLYEDLYKQEETHWWHKSKRELCIEIIDRLIDKKKLQILDIGCGAGKNVEVFSKYGKTYGVDSSPEAIRFCKKRGLKSIHLASSEKTYFQNKSFDLVTLLDVLEHTDERKTLEEINRILKPNGYLLVTVPAFQWLWSNWDVVLHHKRRYTAQNLKKKLVQQGFRVKKLSYVYSFLLIPVILIRSIKTIILKKNYSSDFGITSPLLNLIFLKLSWLERKMIFLFSIPFGTSVVCLAQKM